MPIFSANGAGVITKIPSLVSSVNELGAGIITLQETHFTRKGKLADKLGDFEMFEAIRKKQKGGTLIGVHKSLDPILIEEYSEDYELLVVEVKLGGRDTRLISDYGPQENWKMEEKMKFFGALEVEILNAKLHSKAVYIQMDANSKLGPDFIKGDPHPQSENGKILAGIIKRNALIVMNSSSEKCKGVITRRRITKKVKEESIIDFVIVCEDMEDMIRKVTIDEERKHILTRHTKTKYGVKVKESDHHTIITEISVKWNKKKNMKTVEIYNLKDKEGLKKFKDMTNKDSFLSEVFEDETKNISVKTKQFVKRLGYCLSQCFRKIRIKQTKRNKEIEMLFNRRRILRTKVDDASIEALELVDKQLSDMCSKDNMKLIDEACKGLSCEMGGINSGKLWQLKKRLRGIISEPPCAMLDEHGNLVTSQKGLDDLLIKQYKERLQTLKIKDGLKVHQMQREKTCQERLEKAQQIKTPQWTMSDLEKVLKQLKNNKSRDPMGLANELFKPINAGEDLKIATLKLVNQIKTTQEFPDILKQCNITSLYKNKGSRKDIENYRGIFRVTILRSILDKLIYNDEYPGIDQHLTDSNVGARKSRNIRDNIFVVNAVLNNIAKKKLKDTDIGIYDAYKCFDKLWAQEVYNDIYDNGFNNDKLNLLYKENVNAQFAIKTKSGTTKRESISEIIMQGTVWGSLMCTGTMDKLGKVAYSVPDILYKYKGIPIPPLGMIDDILTVSSVENSQDMNKLINTFFEHKKLKLSSKKSYRIHIGKGHENCPDFKVHEDQINEVDKEKYLGDVIDKSGTIQATIDQRKAKGDGIVAEIISIINEIPLGEHKVQVALKLRDAMLINGILYNSEAWHGVTSAQIAKLEAVDESLLRSILKAHSKTAKEFLYLETGTIPLRWIVAQRRIHYLKHILSREDTELLKKVFLAQQENPTRGDFVKLVTNDLEVLGVTYEEVISGNMTKKKLKEIVQDVAFRQLLELQKSHIKIKHITYDTLQLQSYLASEILTQKDREMLTLLRSQCVRGIRKNFSKMYKNNLSCPLNCETTQKEDSQEHILLCSKLSKGSSLQWSAALSAETDVQAEVAKVFRKLMKKREHLLETDHQTNGLPGASILDPSSRRHQPTGVARHIIV